MTSLFRRMAAAAAFLSAGQQRLQRASPERFSRLAWPLMALGAAWGLAQIAVWDVLFRLTWPVTLNWVVPAGACAAATLLGPYRPAAMALARLGASGRPWLARGGWIVLAGALWALLNFTVRSNPDWPTVLPQSLAWLWPRALYRVLLLAPVWGHWSMLAAVQFHRPDERTDPPTRVLACSISPLAAAAAMLLSLTGSLVCLNFLYPVHFIPPAGALLGGLGGGTLLVRLTGRMNRQVLLGTNLLAQLGFLLAYLAVR